MSTHISGYKLKPGTDIFAFSRKVRELFLPQLQKIIAEEYLKEWVKGYDIASFDAATHQMYLRDYQHEGELRMSKIFMNSKEIVSERIKNVAWAYDMKLGFLSDPVTGDVLCHWSGSQELKKAFNELDEVEDYSYWDSTENPSHVTREEWLHRSKVWDRAFLPSGHVPTSALVASISSDSERFFWTHELLDGRFELPSMESRIRTLVNKLIEDEISTSFRLSGEEFVYSVYMDKYREVSADVYKCQQWEKRVTDSLNPLTVESFRDLHKANDVILPSE